MSDYENKSQQSSNKPEEKIVSNTSQPSQQEKAQTDASESSVQQEESKGPKSTEYSYYGNLKYPKKQVVSSFPDDLTLGDNSRLLSSSSINPPVDLPVPEDSFSTIYDEFNDKIIELGFEDKVYFSTEFSQQDIKLNVEEKKYVVYGRTQVPTQKDSTTVAFHSFEHVREFNRKIRNVEIEVGRGVASVYGEFDD